MRNKLGQLLLSHNKNKKGKWQENLKNRKKIQNSNNKDSEKYIK